MKFIVNSQHLLKHLSQVNGVISTNPVVPILDNFLFELDKNTLTVTASDLQTTMITDVTVESKEKGSIAVPAKKLLDALRELPDQPLTFSIDSASYSINIVSSNGNYKLAGENATDFPKVQAASDEFSAVISSDILRHAITSTIFAASKDDLRPAMTGVYINISEKNSTFVATDGHRLVRYRRTDVKSAKGNHIIIPQKTLLQLKNTLPVEATEVTINFNLTNAFFLFGSVQLICRLIDEKYPDYENVIPKENPITMTINRLELLGSLKRNVVFANTTTYQVRLKVEGSKLQVSAEDLDFSNESTEMLSCEHDGEDIEIGFNARFLIDMLSNIEATEIVLSMSTPNKAGVIRPKDPKAGEDTLMLVMPVMIHQYS